mmetsp:Transcript_21539/g.33032  ORF Transcript_21539/g.33032 Transcript_21539/m.33032 type:complete len:109 (-) Transcript_21539:339-665(-)
MFVCLFLGLFPFQAPFLPWVMLAFSALLGNPATTDLVGIAVGHTYYYFEYVWPVLADLRGWRPTHFLRAPSFVHRLLSALIEGDWGAAFTPAADIQRPVFVNNDQRQQ